MKTVKMRGLNALQTRWGLKRSGILAEGNRRLRFVLSRIPCSCFEKEEGQSLVEFALVAPILIAVVMAIFELGIAFNNQLTLTQAVGAGAQRLQTIRTATNINGDPCAAVLSVIEGAAPQLAPAHISMTVTANGTQLGGNSCSGDQSDLQQGDPVTVHATYPCNITLFAINLDHLSAMNFNCNLTAQVTEYEY